MTANGMKGGSHALRRRCPCCGHRRKFFEPPGDQGGHRWTRVAQWKPVLDKLGFKVDPARALWVLTPFGWACVYCAIRHSQPYDVIDFIRTARAAV